VRIAVLTLGTRGDTEPFVALGRALRERGHEVRLAALEPFRELVAAHELEFFPWPGDAEDMFTTDAWARLVVRRWNVLAHVRALGEMIQPVLERIGPEQIAAACDGVDAVVFTANTAFARQAALERRLPFVMATLGPFEPTGEFPHPILASDVRFGRVGNRLSYAVVQRLTGDILREPVGPRNRAQAGLGVLPIPGGSPAWPRFPVVVGVSEAVLPRPRDWPPQVRQTGFWLTPTPAGAAVPEALEEFLSAGAPPVYVSFGSMRPVEAERLLGAVLTATERLGLRLVLGSGFARAARSLDRPDVYVAETLPHELVLPRFRSFVHHGGAGTLARGLAAGLPTLVVPFVFDQWFWGSRVAAIGAGHAPIRRHELTADRLTGALQRLESPPVKSVAAAVGQRLRAEDGAGDAARVIEELVGSSSP
jgi:UDP:flavonoid glycosyltransferase YjiC (YdhE family)